MNKRVDHEGPIHRAIIDYLRLALPNAVVHHSPNEVPLQGRDVARAMAKARYNGTLAGWPDIEAFWRGRALMIEVKSAGGKLAPAQIMVRDRLAENGQTVYLCRSVDDAAAAVRHWLSIPEGAVGIPLLGVIS